MYQSHSAASWIYRGLPPSPTIEQFHKQLSDYNVTPLTSLPELAKELGVHAVVVKDESDRFGLPAFKILGASWAIYSAVAAKCNMDIPCSLEELGRSARAQGLRLVTCTEGNWGRATARMAKYLQIPATVFVSQFMEQATRDLIASEGAQVTVVDGDYDMSIAAARRYAQETGGLLVMDVSWEGYEDIPQKVVEGYSTMLTETDRQLAELVGLPATHVLASVGVGSFAQAVCMHYKSKERPAFVVAVEPDSAACLQTSLKAGKIVPIRTRKTIMNGMNCGTVSFTAWEVLRKGVDLAVSVDDLQVHLDVQDLHSCGVPCGPCGAAPLSALRHLMHCREGVGLGPDSVIVLFSTEGAREYEVPERDPDLSN